MHRYNQRRLGYIAFGLDVRVRWHEAGSASVVRRNDEGEMLVTLPEEVRRTHSALL